MAARIRRAVTRPFLIGGDPDRRIRKNTSDHHLDTRAIKRTRKGTRRNLCCFAFEGGEECPDVKCERQRVQRVTPSYEMINARAMLRAPTDELCQEVLWVCTDPKILEGSLTIRGTNNLCMIKIWYISHPHTHFQEDPIRLNVRGGSGQKKYPVVRVFELLNVHTVTCQRFSDATLVSAATAHLRGDVSSSSPARRPIPIDRFEKPVPMKSMDAQCYHVTIRIKIDDEDLRQSKGIVGVI
eukprot:gene21-biopygen92